MYMKHQVNLRESEKKVLQLFLQQFTPAEIAQTMRISAHTVKSHLSKLERLGVLKKEGIYPQDMEIMRLFENINQKVISKIDKPIQNTGA